LSDAKVAAAVSLGLIVLGGWPLALTVVPPYQDLPNHLAAVTVMRNLAEYPEFVFNGFWKTNSALFAWLSWCGSFTSLETAARVFAFFTLVLNAIIFPRVVLELSGSRERTLVSGLVAWPMVHNWFVSTGMLDFALAVPLSLALLIAVHRQIAAPSPYRVLAIAVLGAITWYAHVFPVLVVFMLIALEAIVRAPVRRALGGVALPLLPTAVFVASSLLGQVHDSDGAMSGYVNFHKVLPVWELAYNAWAEWMWGHSKFTVTSLVPVIVLFVVGLRRRQESVPFFSPLAMIGLTVAYCFCPYIATNWFHVNSRFLPYLWTGLLVRVPPSLPRALVRVLGVAAVAYSIGMGADFIRLEREREEFTAGIDSVPRRASLLPLLFQHSASSDNTRSLLHYWGYYVAAKHTAAPLLFAHSRSFPVMYSAPPPARFNHLGLEGFARDMRTVRDYCHTLLVNTVITNSCETAYRDAWKSFWAEATPRYDYVLAWDITADARAQVPAEYRPIFEKKRLLILARTATPPRVAPTTDM